jgi:hypothetical protein
MHSSRSVARKRFYSGDLTLDVRLLEGARRGTHGYQYRVTITVARGNSFNRGHKSVQLVNPPAHLSHAVDSLTEMRGAAHAAISFAGDHVSQYAAHNGSGWHVSSTAGNAWSSERGERLREHLHGLKYGRRDPGRRSHRRRHQQRDRRGRFVSTGGRAKSRRPRRRA